MVYIQSLGLVWIYAMLNKIKIEIEIDTSLHFIVILKCLLFKKVLVSCTSSWIGVLAPDVTAKVFHGNKF
jgi:hypothetical protein